MRPGTLFAAPLIYLLLIPAASAADVSGTYSVEGTNLDGSKYSGTVEITMSSDQVCQIIWNTGGDPLPGVCMRNGDTFVAAYISNGAAGLVLYKIQPDGTLNGVWTATGQSGLGTDILTPSASREPPITSNPEPHGDYGTSH